MSRATASAVWHARVARVAANLQEHGAVVSAAMPAAVTMKQVGENKHIVTGNNVALGARTLEREIGIAFAGKGAHISKAHLAAALQAASEVSAATGDELSSQIKAALASN
jgi:hypothetical protein